MARCLLGACRVCHQPVWHTAGSLHILPGSAPIVVVHDGACKDRMARELTAAVARAGQPEQTPKARPTRPGQLALSLGGTRMDRRR